MKPSISLADGDVEAHDRYAKSAGLPSRWAAIQRAIGCGRVPSTWTQGPPKCGRRWRRPDQTDELSDRLSGVGGGGQRCPF